MKWLYLQHDEDLPSKVAQYEESDIGCFVQSDVVQGEYTAYRLLDLAKEHGFPYTPAYEDDMEALEWLTIQAEKWMAENTLYPENTRWGWDSNGDFGLWELED